MTPAVSNRAGPRAGGREGGQRERAGRPWGGCRREQGCERGLCRTEPLARCAPLKARGGEVKKGFTSKRVMKVAQNTLYRLLSVFTNITSRWKIYSISRHPGFMQLSCDNLKRSSLLCP